MLPSDRKIRTSPDNKAVIPIKKSSINKSVLVIGEK